MKVIFAAGGTGGHIVVYNSFLQLLFYALVITVTAGLVYLENHLSGTILILAIGVIMMYLGEIKRHWFVLIAVIAAVAIIMTVSSGCRTLWTD